MENEHWGQLGRHFSLISRRRESWLPVSFNWQWRTFLEASSKPLFIYNWLELVQMSASDIIINRIGGNLLSPTGVTPGWDDCVWTWIREQTEVCWENLKLGGQATTSAHWVCIFTVAWILVPAVLSLNFDQLLPGRKFPKAPVPQVTTWKVLFFRQYYVMEWGWSWGKIQTLLKLHTR